MWQEGKRYIGVAIPGASKVADTPQKCMELCSSTPGCNAATYTTTTSTCWPSTVSDGIEEQAESYQESPDNDSIRLCTAAAVR